MAFLRGFVLTLAALAVATVLVFQFTGPSSTDAGAVSTTVPASPDVAAEPSTVRMKDIQFAPSVLRVPVGATVTWRNDDPMGHTVTPADKAQWGSQGSGDDVDDWLQQGNTWSFTFSKPGVYVYYCLPHASKGADGQYRGMVGTIVVGEAGSIPKEPEFVMPTATVVPSPVAPARTQPDADGVVRLHLTTKEVTARPADGVAYNFWTFDGTVPGPMLRIREGDTVELTLHNDANSTNAHSIDLHAVTGPGGGAKVTQTAPGGTTSFRFKALDPGLYVYHCATPHIPSHVANGMYGLILVEPAEGLPSVDREFYVVEGELYTLGGLGAKGLQGYAIDKMMEERPDYFLFNGAVGALTGDGALKARVGETVRIYFGVGGGVPSSFHVIGEVFDEVRMDGNGAATLNRQTVLVPAAGAAVVDFKVEYPGAYVLVDHTLTRTIDRGAAGVLVVEGAEDPTVFSGTETAGSGH